MSCGSPFRQCPTGFTKITCMPWRALTSGGGGATSGTSTPYDVMWCRCGRNRNTATPNDLALCQRCWSIITRRLQFCSWRPLKVMKPNLVNLALYHSKARWRSGLSSGVPPRGQTCLQEADDQIITFPTSLLPAKGKKRITRVPPSEPSNHTFNVSLCHWKSPLHCWSLKKPVFLQPRCELCFNWRPSLQGLGSFRLSQVWSWGGFLLSSTYGCCCCWRWFPCRDFCVSDRMGSRWTSLHSSQINEICYHRFQLETPEGRISWSWSTKACFSNWLPNPPSQMVRGCPSITTCSFKLEATTGAQGPFVFTFCNFCK